MIQTPYRCMIVRITSNLVNIHSKRFFAMGILAVFDLDYTVWPANADIDFMRPLQRVPSESGDKKTRVYDLRNREVTIYPEMEKIFKFLTDKQITIAISSKDRDPEVI